MCLFLGAAYVLQRSSSDGTWSEISKLTADDSAVDDHFGDSVSFNCESDNENDYYAIIGVPDNEISGLAGTTHGNLYVFQMNETDNTIWNQIR